MKSFPSVDFVVRWKPFLLRPHFPVEGKAKDPDTPSNPRVNPRMKAVGAAAGINFTGKTDRYPNTVFAHALLKYAEKDYTKQNELQEVLFRHYFTDGRYPDATNLRAAAEEVGLNAEEAISFASSPKIQAEVKQEALAASSQGISGVPFFIINDQPCFSGAQPPERFEQIFNDLQ